jgi:pimeloyl-ACP methyl ester carboxylesterase
VERLADSLGEPISLVGWSMGGLFAFDAAQQVPAAVRGVVTLGSPFGDPRGTAMWNLMRRLSGSDVPVEEQDFSTWLAPHPSATEADRVPTTIVYSARDGIVGTEVARMQGVRADDDRVRYRQVESSHLGFTVNLEVFRTLAEVLAHH